MQALILLTLWGAAPSISTARADGIPDTGAQQQEIISQLKSTNDKLDKLITLLGSGDLQVKLVKPDDAKGAKANE
jgi:hypothetical protein